MKYFSKRISLSLRAKLTLLIECFVVILVAVTGVIVILHEKETFENELRKRGIALASDLSNFIARPLINRDLATLRRFVNNSMKQEYVRYVAILDPEGKVVMHSELSEIGKMYKADALESNEPRYSTVQKSDREETHTVIYSPVTVSTLRLGTVLLGYSHRAVEKEIAQSEQRIFIIGLFTSIAGGFVAYLLATFISAPIRRITDATEKVAKGYLDTSLSIQRNDEIGMLANAFNKMTMDLRQSTVSKDYVDNIIGSMNDTLVVVTPDARIRSVNKAMCKLLQYEKDELIGKDIHLILPQERPVFTSAGFQKILNGETVTNYKLDYKTKTGNTIPMLFSAALLKNKEGIIEGIVGIARDITEQEQAASALRASEQKYRTLFEESKDVVYISTPDGKFLDINPAGIELFGYSTKDELLQIDIIHDLYDRPEKREIFQHIVMKEGFAKDYEVVFKRKDGKKVIVLLTSTAVRNEQGEIIAYQGIMKDITEWKRLEQQLLQAQKMEAIGTLAGGIAHDFNNILTVIIGYGSILQQRNQDDTLRPYITLISDAAQNAANLTRSLLAFSRRQIITPKPANLNEIVKGVVKILSRIIGEDIELSLALTGKELTVMADTGQIEQVMMNLVTNARDAMPDGGKLTIRTDLVRFDYEFIKAHGFGKSGSYAVISIQDTGQGMDEETRERLFEPFYTTKEPGKGTGLGLSMVYGIIKQHDGYLHLQSEPKKGTIFTIYLPLITPPDEGTKPAASPFLKGGTEKVLIVEDNNQVRSLIKETLTRVGYNTVEAKDGDDAIRVFHENRDQIQLLILDVIMPKKNGKDVYDEIKRVNPHIKAIFMSGYDARIIHEKGVLQKGLNFIAKPILPDELLQKVRGVLDEGGTSKLGIWEYNAQ
jgi:PAS domain S-box-containing protein